MLGNKNLKKQAMLYLLVLLCLIFVLIELKSYRKYQFASSQYSENSEINLKISSDDLIALNNKDSNKFFRSVKMLKDNEYINIEIRCSENKNSPFELKIDDDIYKLYELNPENINKYSLIQIAKHFDLEASSIEVKDLCFNEVSMGTFLVEKKVYELVRRDDTGYFVSLDSETEFIRNLRYMLKNELPNALDKIDEEKLARYTIIGQLHNNKYDFDNLYFLYNGITEKIEPYACMDMPDSKIKESERLYSQLSSSYIFKQFLNKLDDKLIDNIITTNNKIYAEFNIDSGKILKRKNMLSTISNIKKGIQKKDKTIKEKVWYEANNKWECMTISNKSGFYEKPFKLEFEIQDGYRVYYTIDGSEPTINSYLYEKPIDIYDRSNEPDVLSQIRTTSLGWKNTLSNSFKGTAIRCRVFKDSLPVSDIVTNTYFVTPNMKERYTLPVISLVTDKDNLFGYDKGIYVFGRIRGWWKSKNPGKPPTSGSSANYTRRGRVWERPIHMEWFEPNGAKGFSINLGTRINGGWSRRYPMKSLRFYARSEYDEENIIKYEMFPGLKKENSDEPVDEFKRFLLRNSGHDVVLTMFEDGLTQGLMDGFRIDTQSYRPVVVFINGEYWGIHNLRERQDERYIQTHYDMELEDFVILENRYGILHGTKEDKKHYTDTLEYIRTHDITKDEVYENVKTKIDIENFINYYTLQIYLVNLDWPGNNSKMWRRNTIDYEPNTPYGFDGRWRWLLYDTEGGFKYYRYDMIDYMTKEGQKVGLNAEWATFLFRSLLKNDEFRNQFLCRVTDMLNTNLKPEHILEKIEEYKHHIEPEMQEHINRWNTCGKSMEGWESNINILREFAKSRPKFMLKHFSNHFGLDGTCDIKYSTNIKEAGKIIINGYETKFTDCHFEGTYFKGITNTVRVEANNGYVFKGWQGDIASHDSTINISPSDNISIIAVFEKK
ncbi:CotH kinase family protein [Clostridiaceae bacterium M8S5]|nr:CotH kinase family protein [Clostridiaceae bacterium M8S5]